MHQNVLVQNFPKPTIMFPKYCLQCMWVFSTVSQVKSTFQNPKCWRPRCLQKDSCQYCEPRNDWRQFSARDTLPQGATQPMMSETGFWQLRQDQDFLNHNPFFETGIETLKRPIPFSRLGSRLSICQSLFGEWD